MHAYMIEFEGQRSGWVSCFPAEGVMSIGYVIVRELWGRGIATEALRLLLLKDLPQPLYARIATTNVASRRVLEKNGFKVIQQEWMPECERYQRPTRTCCSSRTRNNPFRRVPGTDRSTLR